MRKEKLEELKRYLEELRTIKMDEISINNPFLTSKKYKCHINNGRIIEREKIFKGGKEGSVVIIVPEVSGEYLTVIEPRVFTRETVGIGFPAGYIENGEKPEEAALRELREETGYVSEQISILDSYYQDEGISSAYNYIMLARNCIKKYPQDLDNDEIIKYMLFSYEELLELEKKGYISGGNTKLALNKIRIKEMK